MHLSTYRPIPRTGPTQRPANGVRPEEVGGGRDVLHIPPHRNRGEDLEGKRLGGKNFPSREREKNNLVIQIPNIL